MLRRHMLALALCLAGSFVAGSLQAAQNSTGGLGNESSSCTTCRACNVNKKSGCGSSRLCTSECNRACTDCMVRGFSIIRFTSPKPYQPGAELPSSRMQPQ
jgi:hypothetical protein